MNALVFVPDYYTIGDIIVEGLEANGYSAKCIDYKSLVSKWISNLYVKTGAIPKRFTKKLYSNYYDQINEEYIKLIDRENPDLIVIYNNQLFNLEVLKRIKQKCKVIFFLGDYPLFSDTYDYNLAALYEADLIISPDTYWMHSLQSMGVTNIYFDVLGYSDKTNYLVDNISDSDMNKYGSDFVFVGRNYPNSFGYKRTNFCSLFADYDFKIYGGHDWDKWLDHFPDLKKNMQYQSVRISNEQLNLIMNCSKMYPVEQNAGLINGIHVRVFECIGSGILPIVEYRPDIDIVFKEVIPPVIKNYGESRKIIDSFINDDERRMKLVRELREYIELRFTPQCAIKRMLNKL